MPAAAEQLCLGHEAIIWYLLPVASRRLERFLEAFRRCYKVLQGFV